MNRRLLWVIMLTLVAFMSAVHAEARVFRLRGLALAGGSIDYSAIGERLYGAVIEVDGRALDVTVMQGAASVESLKSVSCKAGGMMRSGASDRMGLGEIREGGKRVRLLTLPLKPGSDPLVVAVQLPADGGVPPGMTPADVAAGVSMYREGAIKHVMRNINTGTTLWLATTADEPAVVMDYYRSALTRAGWKAALPDASPPGQTTMICFVKGQDMCWVYCRRVESDGGTRLTLVNRKGGLN